MKTISHDAYQYLNNILNEIEENIIENIEAEHAEWKDVDIAAKKAIEYLYGVKNDRHQDNSR